MKKTLENTAKVSHFFLSGNALLFLALLFSGCNRETEAPVANTLHEAEAAYIRMDLGTSGSIFRHILLDSASSREE